MPPAAEIEITYGEAIALLEEVFQVAGGKHDKFLERIRQLQRLDIPKGNRGLGRGVRFPYRLPVLLEISAYLDLLDLKVAPNHIRETFALKFGAAFWRTAWADALRERSSDEQFGPFLSLHAGGLFHLRQRGEEKIEFGPVNQYMQSPNEMRVAVPHIILPIGHRARQIRDAARALYGYKFPADAFAAIPAE
ncbi:MAG TPA: hypothetical protein VGF77_13270 [Allosphingosinicella sp.]|jgi:hypothetical protein